MTPAPGSIPALSENLLKHWCHSPRDFDYSMPRHAVIFFLNKIHLKAASVQRSVCELHHLFCKAGHISLNTQRVGIVRLPRESVWKDMHETVSFPAPTDSKYRMHSLLLQESVQEPPLPLRCLESALVHSA